MSSFIGLHFNSNTSYLSKFVEIKVILSHHMIFRIAMKLLFLSFKLRYLMIAIVHFYQQ